MKKYLCFILVCLLSFMLIGCDNNEGVSEITNPYENVVENELTNPGEYLSDLCKNVKIDDTDFLLPCTFEELSCDFTLTEIEKYDYTIKSDSHDIKTYNLFTNDDKYFGTVSFSYYPDGSNRIFCIDKNYLKNWYTLPEKDDEHINDITQMEFNGLMTDTSTHNEVVSVLGKGNPSTEKSGEYYFTTYTFEDGGIVVYYSAKGDIAVNFLLIFK